MSVSQNFIHGPVAQLGAPVSLLTGPFPFLKISYPFGRLAQLGERSVRNAEVVGSIPIPSTKQKVYEHPVFVYLLLFSTTQRTSVMIMTDVLAFPITNYALCCKSSNKSNPTRNWILT